MSHITDLLIVLMSAAYSNHWGSPPALESAHTLDHRLLLFASKEGIYTAPKYAIDLSCQAVIFQLVSCINKIICDSRHF